MLGTFPYGFFPRVFCLVATSKLCNFQLPKHVLASVPGPLAYSSRKAPPPSPSQFYCSASIATCGSSEGLIFGKLTLGKLYIWEVATWEVTLGKMPLGKYLTPKNKAINSQLSWLLLIGRILIK